MLRQTAGKIASVADVQASRRFTDENVDVIHGWLPAVRTQRTTSVAIKDNHRGPRITSMFWQDKEAEIDRHRVVRQNCEENIAPLTSFQMGTYAHTRQILQMLLMKTAPPNELWW